MTDGLLQASELASLIVTQRDLGCQATGIIHLDEGVNTDSPQAAEFWKLLGGQTQYKGKRHISFILYTVKVLTSYLVAKPLKVIRIFACVFVTAGPDGAADDEHFEKAISESNCIYSLQGDRLRPHEQGWASIPHLTLLDSSQVLTSDLTINESMTCCAVQTVHILTACTVIITH